MRLLCFFLIGAIGLSSTLAAKLPADGIAEPGSYKQLMSERAGPFRRSYWLHIPRDYDEGEALPLLVVLHGAFSSAAKLKKQSGFDRLADEHNFLAAYPNGMGLFGLFRHWNSGHCCGKARKKGMDDVAFLSRVVEEIAGRLNVDRTRIYVVGHSNGGTMAHRFTSERAALVAGFAAVSGTIGGKPAEDQPLWTIRPPAVPVPALLIHGRVDQNVPYGGGHGPGSHGSIETISAAESARFWFEHDGCDPEPDIEYLLDQHVERRSWHGCSEDTEVILDTLEGWGHDWPGGPFLKELPVDDPLRDYHAAERIWDFLQRHRRMP
jgi:polyhydroxybutyrate depolymerase